MWPELKLRIAFANDPFDASPSWADISSDLRRVQIKRGRQHELDRIEPGTMTVELNNEHGNYWPLNEESDYYPNVLPNKRVNIYATWKGVDYHLYTGFIEDWNPGWIHDKGFGPIVSPSCVDVLSLIANLEINDDVGYPQELSGVRVARVLDAVGWPGIYDWQLGIAGYSELGETTYLSYRGLDDGQSILQATGPLENENAMEHLWKVQDAELGVIYQRGDGNVNFDDRHNRILKHSISFAVFGPGGLPYHGLEPHFDNNMIRNDIRITRIGGVQQSAQDTTSQAAFGKRTLSKSDLLLASDLECQDQANYLKKRYKDPTFRISSLKVLPAADPALWPVVLGAEIGRRITLKRPGIGLDKDYYIEGIQHDIDLTRLTWEVNLQLSEADSQTYWILGIEGSSELGEITHLAY